MELTTLKSPAVSAGTTTPDDWKPTTLGKFIALRRGHDLTWRERRSGKVPVMGAAGQNGYHDTAIQKGPGVTLGRSGASFGQANLCEVDFWPHNTALYVTDFRGNYPLFVYYFLDSIDFSRHNSGGAQQSLNRNFIAPIEIVVPEPEEQRAIAGALSDVDALLGGLDKMLAKKRDLKQAAMQQLLTGQTRLPGFSGEWEEKTLGSLAKIQRGASPRPIDLPIWFDDNSSIGWVRISDVTKSGMYLKTTKQRLSPRGVESSRPVERGNLLMSMCATVGRPIITDIDVCIHDGFVVFNRLAADLKFAYYVLQAIEKDWSKHGQTGSQMNLNTDLIKGTEISIPSEKEEQTAIAEVLSDMDAEIAALERRREKTQDLKQGMMQELLTGKTRLV